MRAGALALALLPVAAACAPDSAPAPENAAAALEAVARERGLVRDATAALTGAYARGADRLCMVPAGENYAVGILVAYDDANRCLARGSARRTGDGIRLDLGKGCAVTARFDGERLGLPGRLPDACAAACRGHASLAGLTVERLSDVVAEAAALRDANNRALCRA